MEGRGAWVLFIHLFFTFILCKFFVTFFNFLKGEEGMVLFHSFFKKILKGGSALGVWGSFFFSFFCYFLFILEGGRGHEFFFIFSYS